MKKNLLSIFEKVSSSIENVSNSKYGPFIVAIIAVLGLFAIERDSEIKEAAMQYGHDANEGSQFKDYGDFDDDTSEVTEEISDEDQEDNID